MNLSLLSAAALGLAWGWLSRWRWPVRGTQLLPAAGIGIVVTSILAAQVALFTAAPAAGAFLAAVAGGALCCHAFLCALARRQIHRL